MSNEKMIQHIYWRAGFGLSPTEWQQKKSWTKKKAINDLFTKAYQAQKIVLREEVTSLADTMENLSMEEKIRLDKKAKSQLIYQGSDWVERMASPDESPFLEKMCLFWHGHFACITKEPVLGAKQLNTIRKNALGNFYDLLLGMSKDVAMIRFLNNQQNRKSSPNENFARELMELFTIGRGHYKEQDVKEAARAFTGWSSDKKAEYIFKIRQHDFGRKTFMGKTGNFDGDDILKIILERKETAQFISRKAYRFFVNEKVDEKHVNQLSDIFYNSNYDISTLMRSIFESDWFYDSKNIGVRIKSPVELIAGLIRGLNIKFNNPKTIALIQKALGQVLFVPPNVAGWEGGKAWIDNSTLMTRLNLANYIYLATDVSLELKNELETKGKIKNIKKIDATIDFDPLIKYCGIDSYENITKTLSDFFISPKINLAREMMQPFLIKSNQEDFIKILTMRLLTLPEYQLC